MCTKQPEITSNTVAWLTPPTTSNQSTGLFGAEGLAVGVGFGAIGKSPTAILESARYCSILACHYLLMTDIPDKVTGSTLGIGHSHCAGYPR